MESTKLYQTLSEFDAYQLNRLSKFVHSPYFNVSQKISKLYNILHAHFRHQEDLPTKEQIYVVCDAEATQFEDRKYRKLVSDLLKLVEHFLAVEEFSNNPLHQANYLLDAIQELKLEKLYNTSVKTARRLAARQPYRTADYHFYQYQIEKNYYELSEAELNRSQRSNIDSIIQNLDYFYLSEKLKYYCTLLSRKKIQQHEYEILFIDEILTHIEEKGYEDHPEILVYFYVFKLYDNASNYDAYYKLKELIKEKQEIFTKHDLRDIYLAAINFCISNLNKGQQGFISESLSIYKQALNAGALFVDYELSPWSFKNIVIVGLRAGEYEWVEQFIEQYATNLNPKHRENAVRFNKARLHYYKKEYNKVIPLLNTVEFTDFSYNLGAKAILLASFYELDEFDLLINFLDSFRAYLNRHKGSLPESRRKNYLNLIKFTKKLANVVPGDKEKLKRIEREINEQVKVKADLQWLNSKIKELY